MNMQPVPNAQVVGNTTTTTAADGRFTVEIPSGTSQLIVELPDGSQNIYEVTAPGGVGEIEAELFSDPVAATSESSGVTLTPTLDNPAGTATITDPQDGGTIPCPLPPEVCIFPVQGLVSSVLGQPGTPFNVYVSVTPINPPGGGTYPQFPVISVDPATGAWSTLATLGNEVVPPMPGDTLQIFVFVTDELVLPEIVEDSIPFERALDIPGIVYISPFINLTVVPCGFDFPFEFARLVAPPDGACEGLTPTFQWRIENQCSSLIYCSDLITDLGVDPFDSSFEDILHVGQSTAVQVPLDPSRYDGRRFEWGVRVTACEDPNATCPCIGRQFESDIFQLQTSSAVPDCP